MPRHDEQPTASQPRCPATPDVLLLLLLMFFLLHLLLLLLPQEIEVFIPATKRIAFKEPGGGWPSTDVADPTIQRDSPKFS